MSIHKRTGKSGVRYDVRLRLPSGRAAISRTFRTRREAQSFERAELTDRSRGTWVDPRQAEMTFDRWAAQWLASDPAKRPKSKACDESTIRLHLSPTIGKRPVGSVTPLDIHRLAASWDAAPATVRRRYATLRAIFASAVEADVLGRSPCRGVKLPAVQQRAHRQLSPDDVRRLAGEVGAEHRTMVFVGAVLGLRFGECAGLRVGRLDLLRGTLTVAESLGEVGGRLVVGAPKSAAGRRTMTMPVPLVRMLAEHLARRGLTAANETAYVFGDSQGRPVRYANFRTRVWLPAARRAGLDRLGFHDLRRAAATAMVAAGVDVRTAQTRLGHSDPRLTLNVYAQATDEGDRMAAQRLGQHFMSEACSLGTDGQVG